MALNMTKLSNQPGHDEAEDAAQDSHQRGTDAEPGLAECVQKCVKAEQYKAQQEMRNGQPQQGTRLGMRHGGDDHGGTRPAERGGTARGARRMLMLRVFRMFRNWFQPDAGPEWCVRKRHFSAHSRKVDLQ